MNLNTASLNARDPSKPAANASTYDQILRSSSIMGGAQGIDYLIGMVRVKFVAILLGPSGVGLIGIYMSMMSMIRTLSGLGIESSGVREVALANGGGGDGCIAGSAIALRRACWLTGVAGWCFGLLLAWPLSQWAFGSNDHIWAIAVLSSTALLGAISAGKKALLQGVRRIGDLARINIWSALLSTFVAVGLYGWLREDGILPVIIVTAAIQVVISGLFSRNVRVETLRQSWRETGQHLKRLIALGVAFMWSAFLTAVVGLAIRAFIIRGLGVDAAGMYQAAWALSGMFGAFVLSAMGADFYPRLTAVAHDNEEVNRLVNEQTEIGILLALPGLIATLAFAPWLMHLFYSSSFLPAAGLLPWFIVGVFGQVVSWPLGFALIAKGQKGSYIITETTFRVAQLFLSVVLLIYLGLVGVSIAMPFLYAGYMALLLVICGRVTGFRLKKQVIKLLAGAFLLIGSGFIVRQALADFPALILLIFIMLAAGIFSLRGLVHRLGRSHGMIRLALRVPGLSKLL